MTTIYKFVCGYTKAGIATSPSSAPTITIVDSGNNILASAQATTARTNIAGVYDYSYSGADSLDLIGLYHTSDITVDRQDLHSHPYNAVILKAIETAGTVVDAIKVKTDNLPTDPADQSLLEAAITAATSPLATAANLATVDTVVDAIKAKTDNLTENPADQALLETYISVETGPLATSAAVGLVSSVVNIIEGNTSNLPTAVDIDNQLSGTHGAGTWGNATGGGAVLETVTVTVSGLPRDGVEVWVTTDAAGLNLVANGVTDALGEVDFMLDPGTYYVWKQLAGVNFTNPQTTVVS